MEKHAFTMKRLLVPLDGSSLAEAVLPAVTSLALKFEAEVVMIHVLELNAPPTIHGERHLLGVPEGEAYLARLAVGLREKGVTVETHVHDAPEGDIPRSIVEHAEEYSPDLIVLCAHGNHGLRGFLSGRVGQQVLLLGESPVLILQPGLDVFELKSVVVPLDENHPHTLALEVASALAKAFSSEMHLVSVVPTIGTLESERARTGILLPSAMRAILEIDQAAGKERLDVLAAPYRERGIAVFGEVLRGETVASVVKRADALDSGLVVMTTHGNAGLAAFLEGSVAQRVAARIRVPLLLVKEEGR
jgi:nucleotide-binding universal stress UspA family protein